MEDPARIVAEQISKVHLDVGGKQTATSDSLNKFSFVVPPHSGAGQAEPGFGGTFSQKSFGRGVVNQAIGKGGFGAPPNSATNGSSAFAGSFGSIGNNCKFGGNFGALQEPPFASNVAAGSFSKTLEPAESATTTTATSGSGFSTLSSSRSLDDDNNQHLARPVFDESWKPVAGAGKSDHQKNNNETPFYSAETSPLTATAAVNQQPRPLMGRSVTKDTVPPKAFPADAAQSSATASLVSFNGSRQVDKKPLSPSAPQRPSLADRGGWGGATLDSSSSTQGNGDAGWSHASPADSSQQSPKHADWGTASKYQAAAFGYSSAALPPQQQQQGYSAAQKSGDDVAAWNPATSAGIAQESANDSGWNAPTSSEQREHQENSGDGYAGIEALKKSPLPSCIRRGSSPHLQVNVFKALDEDPDGNKADVSILNKILHTKLVELHSDQVDVQHRSNPASPLFSAKTFQELNLKPELLTGVFAMGFTYPSKIQESALPNLLADPPANMIAQAQSGTGKTAAFVLTMLSRINTNEKKPQALCLSPTFELAVQTGKVVEVMGKYLEGLQIAYAVRGEARQRGQQIEDQIIIGTPGTVLDWIVKYRCFDPKHISVFVFDEADVMIAQQGHQDQSIRIHRMLDPSCQMLLFSATYDEEVMRFAESIIHDPIVIRLKREEETLDNIKQYYVECENLQAKFQALANIYGVLTIGQSMIFCRTRSTAYWLAEQMQNAGNLVSLLTGELSIEERASVIQRFKEGREKVLITTNVCARGIDVEQVTIVGNFDLPTTVTGEPDFETYLHRIGRTGRFGKVGIAINFIDGVQSRNLMYAIEAHFGKKIELLDAEDVNEIEKIGS